MASGKNYKPPKAARQRLSDQRYVLFQSTPNGPRIPQTSVDLQVEIQCATILGGKRVFIRHKNKKTKELGWLSFIDGGTRCPNRAQRATRTEQGSTLRTCLAHEHVDHIPGRREES